LFYSHPECGVGQYFNHFSFNSDTFFFSQV